MHLGGVDRADLRHVLAEELGRQADQPVARQAGGDRALLLVADQVTAGDVALGVFQLLGRHRVVVEAAELVDELAQRGAGDFVAHIGRGLDRAAGAHGGEAAAGA
ncbi:hypothetical protein CATMIT_01692, partial [Catenibacterium mitsuokai DSM 15897]